jgi:hypothetical protein
MGSGGHWLLLVAAMALVQTFSAVALAQHRRGAQAPRVVLASARAQFAQDLRRGKVVAPPPPAPNARVRLTFAGGWANGGGGVRFEYKDATGRTNLSPVPPGADPTSKRPPRTPLEQGLANRAVDKQWPQTILVRHTNPGTGHVTNVWVTAFKSGEIITTPADASHVATHASRSASRSAQP